MLYEIMKSINNFFPTKLSEEGDFTIEDGTISLPFVIKDAYVLIEGSYQNDGVYKMPLEGLKDETFRGAITVLAPPKAFLDLAEEIKAFNEKDKTNVGAFSSESFGGYSYTRATNSNGGLADWHDVFRGKLNAWRKI